MNDTFTIRFCPGPIIIGGLAGYIAYTKSQYKYKAWLPIAGVVMGILIDNTILKNS